MARQAAHKEVGEIGATDRVPAAEMGKDAGPARPLDPLITALSRALDRLEGTAG
jgi:hypothetical protein